MTKSQFSIANVVLTNDGKSYALTLKMGFNEYTLYRTVSQFMYDLRGSSVHVDMIPYLKGVGGEAVLEVHKEGDPWIGKDKNGDLNGQSGNRSSDGVTIPHDGGFVVIDPTTNINLIAASMIAAKIGAPAMPVAEAPVKDEIPEPEQTEPKAKAKAKKKGVS